DEPSQSLTMTAPTLGEDASVVQTSATDAYDTQRSQIVLNANQGILLVAPISAQGHRYGVLSVFGTNAAAFAEDDLRLLELLADQVAVILQHRDLIREVTAARARDELNRMREDFLSSAAHDLQTPLT